MGTKGKKVSINHLDRRIKEWVRMLSNGEEKKSMMEKLDCNSHQIIARWVRVRVTQHCCHISSHSCCCCCMVNVGKAKVVDEIERDRHGTSLFVSGH